MRIDATLLLGITRKDVSYVRSWPDAGLFTEQKVCSERSAYNHFR